MITAIHVFMCRFEIEFVQTEMLENLIHHRDSIVLVFAKPQRK